MALRMNKRRTFSVLAGAVSVALVAAACGGGEGGTDKAATAPPPEVRSPSLRARTTATSASR